MQDETSPTKKADATMMQVANLAGVSSKTVSRVINKEPNVNFKTREKVVGAISKLNYRPLQTARILRTKKSGLVGLITSAITYSGNDPGETGLSSIHIVRGVQQACRELGLKLMISDSEGNKEEIYDLIQMLRSYQVEGIIITADRLQKVNYPFLEDTPTVLVNCADDYGTPSIVPNDYQGQQIATKYLIENTHNRIGLLGLPEDNLAYQIRKKGFEDTCKKMGLRSTNYAYIPGGNSTGMNVFKNFDQQLEALVHHDCTPSAIMFGNDIMALRGMRYFLKHSISIPNQISIVGFDNDLRICKNLSPTLTTVQLPYFKMGYRSIYKLKDDKNSKSGPLEYMNCELRIRQSSSRITS